LSPGWQAPLPSGALKVQVAEGAGRGGCPRTGKASSPPMWRRKSARIGHERGLLLTVKKGSPMYSLL